MYKRAGMKRNHQSTHRCATKACQAPQAMKRNHDRTLVQCLYTNALGVDGDIEKIAPKTKQEKDGGQLPGSCGKPQQDECKRIKN